MDNYTTMLFSKEWWAATIVGGLILNIVWEFLKAAPGFIPEFKRSYRAFFVTEAARVKALQATVQSPSDHIILALREQRTRGRANDVFVFGGLLLWLASYLGSVGQPGGQTALLFLGSFAIGRGIQRSHRANRERDALIGLEEQLRDAHRTTPQ